MQTSAIGTLLPIEPCNSLPESGTWCFVFVPRGHAVAQKMSGNLLPTIKRFLLFSPCAPPRSDASGRRFRRALMKQLAIRLSWQTTPAKSLVCLLYTSDAADDLLCVDLGGRRIIKK